MHATPADPKLIDSSYAAWRLLATLGLVALGNSGMYVVSVVLPAVQAEFGVSRGDASLPYTLMMVALGLGGLVTGRMADRFGIMRVLWVGALAVCAGYGVASTASSVWAFALAHGLLLGLVGSSSTFAPLMADTALWWNKRRGIAVAICASGNYLAGSFWPPVVQWGVENWGWRQTYVWMGVFCGLGMLVLSLALKQRPPLVEAKARGTGSAGGTDRPFGLSPLRAQLLLCVAGTACCVAMAMPQVHIVAYCTDLGFGAARGAQMLSLMLACGIASRLVSGLICDRIGGLRTLLLGSMLQGTALLLFLPFDGMVSLYLVSALFGLFQGGIVPSYAIIVREHFKPQEAGARVGAVLMATMIGMALGGWMSGWVFDLTGSYRAAFLNGIAWNLLNMSIAVWLVMRSRKISAQTANSKI
ncbi:MAG: MFS transporter [Betaproteobacteria bacterium]